MSDDPYGLHEWYERLRAEWDPIIDEARRLGVPAFGVSPIGGGFEVLEVALSEEKGHVGWIGTYGDENTADEGPWLSPGGPAGRRAVSGFAYRYRDGYERRHHTQSLMSEEVTVEVADPEDESSVAEAVRDCWRQLKEAECTSEV